MDKVNRYCDTCGKFVSRKNWSRHLKTELHQPDPSTYTLWCYDCGLSFPYKDQLNQHLNTKKHEQVMMIKATILNSE